MSERTIREQRFALEQRLAHTEGNLRAVRLRAWPGAVRTDASFGSYMPEVPTDPAPLVTLSIPAGRWIALGSVTFVVTVPSTDARFRLSITVADALTGLPVSNPATDLLPSDLWFPAVAAGSPASTATIIGDLVADDAVTVTLSSVSFYTNPYTAYYARLRMMPV